MQFKYHTQEDRETGRWKAWLTLYGVVIWREEYDPNNEADFRAFSWSLAVDTPRGLSPMVRDRAETTLARAILRLMDEQVELERAQGFE